MADLTAREQLLVHETVSLTVDTLLSAIQQETQHAEAAVAGEPTSRSKMGVVDGLRRAEGAAATASHAARAAAFRSATNGGENDHSRRADA